MALPIVVLAGGFGRRLGAVGSNKPKILAPINGKPFIDLQLEWLLRNNVDHITYCIGHLGNQIVEHLERLKLPKNIRVNFSWDGEVPLGTGGAVQKAAKNFDSKFLVTYGDSYLRAELNLISETFERSDFSCLMTVFKNQNNFDVSNVQMASGMVIKYDKNIKNSKFEYIDYGILGFSKGMFNAFTDCPNFDLGPVIIDGINQGQMIGYEIYERFFEIGSLEGIRSLENFLKN